MRYLVTFLLALVINCIATPAAHAQDDDPIGLAVRVEIFNSSHILQQTLFYNSGSDINLNSINSTMRYINVRYNFEEGYSVSTNIGRISLSGSTNMDLFVYLGSGTFPTSQTAGQNTAAATDWAGISVQNSFRDHVKLAGGLAGNLTNTVQVGEVYRLDLGAIRAGIETSVAGVGLFRVYAEAINGVSPYSGNIHAINGSIRHVELFSGDIAGPIVSDNGSIVDVITNAGRLLANVLAVNGSIAMVSVTGDIGTSSAPVSIQAKSGISSIDGSRIYANIAANANMGAGDLGHVATHASTGGHFVGSATAHQFAPSDTNPALTVLGDLDADLTATGFSRGLTVSGAFKAGRTISIASNANAANAPFTFGAGGLKGQIILNACNGCDPLNSNWVNTITIGTGPSAVVLAPPTSAPYYAYSSSQLGGGSVGLAPFHLNDSDCVPQNNASVGSLLNNQIVLRFYGPVSWTTGTMPVVVQWRPIGGPTWYTITSDFSASVGTTSRELLVIPATWLDFTSHSEYRVTPASGAILCQGVTGTPAAADFTYTVEFP